MKNWWLLPLGLLIAILGSFSIGNTTPSSVINCDYLCNLLAHCPYKYKQIDRHGSMYCKCENGMLFEMVILVKKGKEVLYGKLNPEDKKRFDDKKARQIEKYGEWHRIVSWGQFLDFWFATKDIPGMRKYKTGKIIIW